MIEKPFSSSSLNFEKQKRFLLRHKISNEIVEWWMNNELKVFNNKQLDFNDEKWHFVFIRFFFFKQSIWIRSEAIIVSQCHMSHKLASYQNKCRNRNRFSRKTMERGRELVMNGLKFDCIGQIDGVAQIMTISCWQI